MFFTVHPWTLIAFKPLILTIKSIRDTAVHKYVLIIKYTNVIFDKHIRGLVTVWAVT